MAQRSPLQRGRALIVEDEIFFALNLEADMHALGFSSCALAATGQQASQLAMNRCCPDGYQSRRRTRRHRSC
jgi:hypothetical protein